MSLLSHPSSRPSSSRVRNSSPQTAKSFSHSPQHQRHAPSSTPGLIKLPTPHHQHQSSSSSGSQKDVLAGSESPNRRSRPRRAAAAAGTGTAGGAKAVTDSPSRTSTPASPLPSTNNYNHNTSSTHAIPLPQHHNHNHDNNSSADEWDMPTLPSSSAPNSALTWQQLAPSPVPAPRRVRTESAIVPPRTNLSHFNNNNQHQHPSRPILSGSVSDSAAATGSRSSSGLTWQQELLSSSSSPSSFLASPANSQSSLSGVSPAKLRRQQIKDDLTFGNGGLSNLSLDDSPSVQVQQQTREYATPVKKQQQDRVERYAGAEFQNSPSPRSLPKPSFLLRRTREWLED
ncbi:hypothetical protein RQP46_008026 [Phenoliferia psychrophenolica]